MSDKETIEEYERELIVKDFKQLLFLADKYEFAINFTKHEDIWDELFEDE